MLPLVPPGPPTLISGGPGSLIVGQPELRIAADADSGWTREVERHQAAARRLAQLLQDLHEPLNDDDPEEQT